MFGRHLHHGLNRQQIPAGGQALHLAHGIFFQHGRQLLLLQLQPGEFPGQSAAFSRGYNILPPLPQPLLQPLRHPAALADAHQRVRGQIVGGAGEFLIHRRHIAVAAAGRHPLAQRRRVRAQGGAERSGLFLFGVALGGGLQTVGGARRAVGGQNLSCRQQQRLPDILHSPLGTGVKPAQGVELIVKKVAPDGVVRVRGEHIQNAAAQGKLPRSLHLFAPGIPCIRQTAAQGGNIVRLPLCQLQNGPGKHLGREAPLAQSLGGGKDHGRCFCLHPVQGGDAAIVPLAAGHGGRPQMQLTGRQIQRFLPRQALHISGETLTFPLIGAQKQQGPLHGLGQSGGKLYPVDGGQSCDDGAAAAVLQFLPDVLQFRQAHQLPQENAQVVPLLSEYHILLS